MIRVLVLMILLTGPIAAALADTAAETEIRALIQAVAESG